MRASLFLAKNISMKYKTYHIKNQDSFVKEVLKVIQEEPNEQTCGKKVKALLEEHVEK